MTSSESKQEVVVFLHVPRTAGTTLSRFLRSKFPPDQVFHASYAAGETLSEQLPALRALSPQVRERLRLIIAGHAEYGQHEALGSKTKYLTVIRDPIDRVISSYRFLHDHPDDPLYPEVVGRKMSVSAFVSSDSAKGINDWQVRCLAGVPWSASEWTADVLGQAKRNIERHFLAVGLTERFPETIVLLGRIFGWRDLHYATLNISSSRTQCSAKDRELILERNQLDQKLYEFASARFDQQLASFSNIDVDLRRLRRENQVYVPIYHAYRAARRMKETLAPRLRRQITSRLR
jgi:hypothetical protein